MVSRNHNKNRYSWKSRSTIGGNSECWPAAASYQNLDVGNTPMECAYSAGACGDSCDSTTSPTSTYKKHGQCCPDPVEYVRHQPQVVRKPYAARETSIGRTNLNLDPACQGPHRRPPKASNFIYCCSSIKIITPNDKAKCTLFCCRPRLWTWTLDMFFALLSL